MVSDKMERAGGDLLVGHETLGRLSVIRELKQMEHIGVLLLEDDLPRVVGDVGELPSEGVVPHLPVRAGKDRVGPGDGTQLELWVGREGLRGQDLVRRGFLLGIVLPLDKAEETNARVSTDEMQYFGPRLASPVRGRGPAYPVQPFRSMQKSLSQSPTALIARLSLVSGPKV